MKTLRRFYTQIIVFFVLIAPGTVLFTNCAGTVPQSEAAAVYYNLGNAYFELNKLDKALEAYQHALSLEKNLSRATYNMARVYLLEARYDDARNLIFELLEEDPENTLLLSTLAYCYSLEGSTDEAMAVYEQILKRDELNGQALYNLGVLYWKKGDMQEALNTFKTLYGLNPGDTSLLYNLGKLELDMKNTDAGIQYLELYIEKKPQDTAALEILGDTYYKQQLYSNALEEFNKILAIDEKKPAVLFKKAFILLTVTGEGEEGMNFLEKSILAGFKDKEQFRQLLNQPDLINREKIRLYLINQDILPESTE